MKLKESEIEGPFLRKPWEFVGVPRSTFYARIKEGRLPEGIHFGGKAVVWPKGVLVRYMAQCVAGAVASEGNA